MKTNNRMVGKRLFQYATLFKGAIILALIMLGFAVAAELSGPFIAKKMIDTHIMGIEKPWYESTEGKDAVSYNGTWYKREDHFESNEQKGNEVRIVQVGRPYYFVNEHISLEGKRSISDGLLTISNGNQTVTYDAKKLTTNEVVSFFRPEFDDLFLLAGIYFVLLLIAGGLHYGQKYLLQSSANRIIQKLRNDVFGQIQRLPIHYFDNLPAGKVVARVTNDTEAIQNLYVTVVSSFFTGIIYMTGIIVALSLLDIRLGLISLIIVPILYTWIKLYRKAASKYNHEIRTRLSDINGMINESIQGMPIIQAFRRQKDTTKEFDKLNEEHFSFQNKMLNLNSLTSHNLVFVMRNIAFVLLIWYFGGASLGVGSIVSMGVLYALVDYLNRFFQPVQQMVNQLANLEQALVAADRVFELIDEEGVDVDTGTLPRYEGNVAFKNVWFSYKDDEYVLKDISFEAKKGQTVALVGHTGSGKSSIMNLLFRFYDVQKGDITIDGHDIRDISRQKLREHMGIVLQDPFLFTGTIASNVSLNDPSITREMVEKALKDVGADDLLKNLPKGYDEPVIEKGSTLSAGQRQLISFARALAFDPAILILDEATANIDTETETIIQQALDVVKQGRTTFIIAHRLSTIKSADLILVLDRGQIVERGNHEELMGNGGRYYQMYQLQQGKALEKAI